MSAVYPLTLAALLKGDVDLDGTVVVQALDDTYVYSAAHDFADDLTGELGAAITLAGKTFTAGLFSADPASLTGIGAGDTVVALVYYIDTGTPSTSRLLAYEDRNADTTAMSFDGNGLPIDVDWPYGLFSI